MTLNLKDFPLLGDEESTPDYLRLTPHIDAEHLAKPTDEKGEDDKVSLTQKEKYKARAVKAAATRKRNKESRKGIVITSVTGTTEKTIEIAGRKAPKEETIELTTEEIDSAERVVDKVYPLTPSSKRLIPSFPRAFPLMEFFFRGSPPPDSIEAVYLYKALSAISELEAHLEEKALKGADV